MALPDPALQSVLAVQSGVLTVNQALRHLTRGQLRWLLDSERWARVSPRVLVSHSGPLDVAQRRWAGLLHAGRTAVLAASTAAEVDGLVGYACAEVHVLVPVGHRVTPQPGLVVRHSRCLTSADVHPLRLPPRTRIARSLVDMASSAGSDERAAAILAAGVQQRLTRVVDLESVVRRLTRVPRRAVLRRTMSDLDGGAHSLPELEFTRLLRRHRLPTPTMQAVRRDSRGRRRWLDAFWPDYAVAVEIDGTAHTEVRQWWADMDRQNEITLSGPLVLRFPAVAVFASGNTVADHVRRGLLLGGWVDQAY